MVLETCLVLVLILEEKMRYLPLISAVTRAMRGSYCKSLGHFNEHKTKFEILCK